MHINKIKIQPNWTFVDEQGQQLSESLFRLLVEIKQNSKLTVAAQHVGISYRSAWNLISKSAEVFGVPLVDLHKGRGAKLTPLGDKLLWAKHRVAARLGPQLDNITSELNIEIQRILTDRSPSVRIHASHGYAVALLPDLAKDFQLDLQYKSIHESLAALKRGDCELAGFDVPTQVVSRKIKDLFRYHLDPKIHAVISFVKRQQGLIVRTGNPNGIKSVHDLVSRQNKFINRQQDSGTRCLLDELLITENINPQQIRGFSDEEYTHSAIAAFIASGMADVGLGIEAAARQFGLDFLPVATEHYLFVGTKQAMQTSGIQQLVHLLQQDEILTEVKKLPGYTPDNSGKIIELREVFDWF